MARKSRKQKKRRTRRKRGGLTPKQTKQCEAAGIPGFPPAKCQEYLTTKKKKDTIYINYQGEELAQIEQLTDYKNTFFLNNKSKFAIQFLSNKYGENSKTIGICFFMVFLPPFKT